MAKQRSVTKDFIVVLIVIIIGKALGLARELVVSYIYGSSVVTDAFYFVNGLITAMFSIITMGLGQAFTPTYLDINIKKGKKCSNEFANKILTILLAFGLFICIILFVFPQISILILGHDLNARTKEIAVMMLRIMAPCVPIYILFSIRKCILNAHQKYIVTEASGIPYSISIVLFSYLLFKPLGNKSLAVAAIIGVLFQYIFTLCFSKSNYSYNFVKIEPSDKEIRRYFVMLAPIAASAILEEANGLLRKELAGGMEEGSIANLSYCMTLTTLVNGIVITSISTVYFPHLIKNYSEDDLDSFKKNISDCISMASVLVIPVVAYLFLFAKDVVQLVYERGSFTKEDTNQVASLFMVYVLGSIVYAYRSIIKTAFFSTQDVKTPMINEMLYLIICIICNVVQVKVLNLGLTSLGVAWVISITIMTPILFLRFKSKHFSLIDKNIIVESCKSVISSIIFILFELLIVKRFSVNNIFINVLISGSSFVIVYSISMILLRSRTYDHLIHSIKRR